MSNRTRIASFALAALAAAGASSGSACESVAYGAGVKLTVATAVGSILDAPESFVGRPVRVEGKVKDVCEMAGCWMEITAADEDWRVLKFKVKDGEIELPVAARGKSAVAEGKVERLEMSRARYLKYRKHIAAEQDQPFDETAVTGDGPFYVYQIAGTGAEICK